MPRPRRAEARITDPASHPRDHVSPTVAAEFLDMDDRAMKHFLDTGALRSFWRGRRRRIHLRDLVEFKASRETGAGRAAIADTAVSRETNVTDEVARGEARAS
jgi:hypothetical protein